MNAKTTPISSTPRAPTPLGLRQRISLMLMRLFMVILGFFHRRRSTPPAPGPVALHRYGPHRSETLELIPRKPGTPERAPVVFVHGGGWIVGSKELYTSDLYFIAEAGHPVFNLDYPLAPENPHPGVLLSLLDALDWMREQYPEHGAVHFVGDSAGGNLALMLGILCANPALVRDLDAGANGGPALACHSVISLYGALDRRSWVEDRVPLARLMLECYGGEAVFEPQVGPELALTPMDLHFDRFPPSFVIAGTRDPLCRSTQLCAEFLAARDGIVESKLYPGERHGFFNFGRSSARQELKRDMLHFLAAHDPAGIG